MAAQQQRLDAVANDLANANTTGYKHQRVGFRDLVYDQTGRSSAQGVRTGSGAAAVDAGRSFAQGSLQRTDRPLDVAIQGEGFLRVRLPDGRDALTRDGSLHIDGAGNLTTSTGSLVQPAIKVPTGTAEDEVSIGADGTVTAARPPHRPPRRRDRPLAGRPALGRRQRLRHHRHLRPRGRRAARDRAHAGRPGGLEHRHGRRHGRR